MVAAPFFFMMFAILELGLVFVTDSVLDNALTESGRLIRTGQAEAASMDAEGFKTEVCDRMSVFSAGCRERATFDVREIPQFRNPTPPDPLANGEEFEDGELTYVTGEPGSLMLVRVWYRYPLITPFLSQALSRLGDGDMIMTATTTFRNEPYR